MQCIFLDGTRCKAGEEYSETFNPSEPDISDFCKKHSFQQCPRYKAALEYAKANAGR